MADLILESVPVWLGNYLKHFYPSGQNILSGNGTERQGVLGYCSPCRVSSSPWEHRVSLQTHTCRSVSRHTFPSCSMVLLPCNVRFPAPCKSCYQAFPTSQIQLEKMMGVQECWVWASSWRGRLEGKGGGREDLRWGPNWWASLLSQ